MHPLYDIKIYKWKIRDIRTL